MPIFKSCPARFIRLSWISVWLCVLQSSFCLHRWHLIQLPFRLLRSVGVFIASYWLADRYTVTIGYEGVEDAEDNQWQWDGATFIFCCRELHSRQVSISTSYASSMHQRVLSKGRLRHLHYLEKWCSSHIFLSLRLGWEKPFAISLKSPINGSCCSFP